MEYPFSFVGKSSLGTDFVGRDSQSKLITERTLEGSMTCIVGLPRMGKTSLINHLFFESGRPEWWAQHHLLPLYVSIDTCATADEFWGSVASQLYQAVDDWVEQQQIPVENKDLRKFYEELQKADHPAADGAFIFNKMTNSLTSLKNLQLQVIFILDELDSLGRYHYGYDHFRKIRALANYGPLITCSRRQPQAIEKKAFDTDYFSNMSEKVFIGTFTPDEVTTYWQHFRPAFSQLSGPEFREYRKLVARYAGNHPHLMNLMNYHALHSGNLTEWQRAMGTSQRYRQEWQFRASLVEAFREQMRYIEEQKLNKTAIAAVLGGERKEDFADQITTLKQYTFIREVTNEEKRALFTYDLGLQTPDCRYRYVCLSDFFSHFMRDNYLPTYKDSELHIVTELKLRELVRAFLRLQFGDDALKPIGDDEYAHEHYEEHWEKPYRLFCERKALLYFDEDNETAWSEIKHRRWQLTQTDCKPPSERPPIDFLTGLNLHQLKTFFLKPLWFTFFGKVLDAEQWGESTYKGNRERWMHTYFDPFHTIRNRDSHRNLVFITEEAIEKAHSACRKICQDIDRWMAQQADSL